jgi:hypothetical protein
VKEWNGLPRAARTLRAGSRRDLLGNARVLIAPRRSVVYRALLGSEGASAILKRSGFVLLVCNDPPQ